MVSRVRYGRPRNIALLANPGYVMDTQIKAYIDAYPKTESNSLPEKAPLLLHPRLQDLCLRCSGQASLACFTIGFAISMVRLTVDSGIALGDPWAGLASRIAGYLPDDPVYGELSRTTKLRFWRDRFFPPREIAETCISSILLFHPELFGSRCWKTNYPMDMKLTFDVLGKNTESVHRQLCRDFVKETVGPLTFRREIGRRIVGDAAMGILFLQLQADIARAKCANAAPTRRHDAGREMTRDRSNLAAARFDDVGRTMARFIRELQSGRD
jgi:hypothetical protein